jgi:hypothetical protein
MSNFLEKEPTQVKHLSGILYLGQAPGLTRIYLTRLERLDRDIHSTLFDRFISDEENKLYNIETLAK